MNSLLVIAIALILGLLSTRLMKLIGLPNVTGYLVVGLIIGPYALGQFVPGAVEAFDGLGIISTVALGFIGFSIGVEFKISHIKEIGKSAVVITFFQALVLHSMESPLPFLPWSIRCCICSARIRNRSSLGSGF